MLKKNLYFQPSHWKGLQPEAKDVRAQNQNSHTANKIVLVLGAMFLIWTIWQHEIMMKPYMNQEWGSTFQFFTGIVVPWGFAYDFTLLGEWIAVMMMLAALWFWSNETKKAEKK